MGSFDATCAVSNLPIHCGTKVKAFLLNKNAYGDDYQCYVHGNWVPRTFAIDAEYNDYGSIQKYKKDIFSKLWLTGLQKDLIEVGTGDNSYHDVPTSKKMSFEDLLSALWEKRVIIDRHSTMRLSPAKQKEFAEKDYTKAHEISLQKARSILSDTKGYLIDQLDFGPIRVRYDKLGADYSKDEVKMLEKVAPLFEKFQTVIVAGSGSYSKKAEMWVVNKPHDKAHTTSAYPFRDSKKELSVQLTLVRKDVWDAMLNIGREDYDRVTYKTINLDMSTELAKVKSQWDKTFSFKKNPPKSGSEEFFDYLHSLGQERRDNVFTCNEGGAGVGLGYHWDLAIDLAAAGKMSDKQIEKFQLDVAEMSMFWAVMGRVRCQFRPFYTAGPQFGDWESHAKIQAAFTKIAEDVVKKQREEYGEDE